MITGSPSEQQRVDVGQVRQVAGHRLADLPDIDTLLLGCTHYPLLLPAIRAALPNDVTVIVSRPGIDHLRTVVLGDDAVGGVADRERAPEVPEGQAAQRSNVARGERRRAAGR